MSDWRHMEAGRDLDRLIAEKLGYKVVMWNGFYHVTANPEKFVEWASRRGTDVNLLGKSSVSAAWEFCKDVPRFSVSVDAALTLWSERSVVVRPNLLHRMWVAAVLARVRLDGTTWEIEPNSLVEAKTPALAICLVWLEWQERMEARHETD